MISLIKIIVYPLIIILGALAVFGYKTARRTFAKYRNVKEVSVDPEWKGLIRNDFNKWDQKGIIRGCFLRLPFKVIAIAGYVLILAVIMKFATIFQKPGFKILDLYLKFQSYFLFTYVIPVKQDNLIAKIKSPIVITNHVCWIDILYMATKMNMISIVSKASIAKVPVVGLIAKFIQCLFIQRENSDARKDIMNQIKQRVSDYQNKENVYPLLIFPQGTTSNGKSILRFKGGAFAQLPKITIYGLIYQCQGFDMGMQQVTPIEHIVLSLSLKPKLTVKSVEIEPLPQETPQKYMLRCQEKLSEITGFKIYDVGYTEKVKLKEMFEGVKKQ